MYCRLKWNNYLPSLQEKKLIFYILLLQKIALKKWRTAQQVPSSHLFVSSSFFELSQFEQFTPTCCRYILGSQMNYEKLFYFPVFDLFELRFLRSRKRRICCRSRIFFAADRSRRFESSVFWKVDHERRMQSRKPELWR